MFNLSKLWGLLQPLIVFRKDQRPHDRSKVCRLCRYFLKKQIIFQKVCFSTTLFVTLMNFPIRPAHIMPRLSINSGIIVDFTRKSQKHLVHIVFSLSLHHRLLAQQWVGGRSYCMRKTFSNAENISAYRSSLPSIVTAMIYCAF